MQISVVMLIFSVVFRSNFGGSESLCERNCLRGAPCVEQSQISNFMSLRRNTLSELIKFAYTPHFLHMRMRIWNFRPKGDGRSGPLGPLLPVKNLTFWYT